MGKWDTFELGPLEIELLPHILLLEFKEKLIVRKLVTRVEAKRRQISTFGLHGPPP